MKVIEYLQVTEYLQGRYTAQEKPFGVVYRWSPERVVECRCGARPTLNDLYDHLRWNAAWTMRSSPGGSS